MRCPNCDGPWSENDFSHFDGEYVWFRCMVCGEMYKAECVIVGETE